jgi:thiamine-monophosphate kinase
MMNSFREDDILAMAADLFRSTIPSGGSVVVGIGDDTAVLEIPGSDRYRLVTTDTIVAGTHFHPDEEPGRIAGKAVAVNVSDIAAMGGMPETMLVSAIVPGSCTQVYLTRLMDGLAAAAGKFNVAIIGGDTVGGPVLALAVTMLGYVERECLCLRSGVLPGDGIAVTGTLGGSLESGKHLDFQPRLAEARWLVQHARPHAMMDLSDGLAKDSARMAVASGASLHIESKSIPVTECSTLEDACREGEDFELLCACVPGQLTEDIITEFQDTFSIPLTIIGSAVEGPATVYLDENELKPEGFEHFEL